MSASNSTQWFWSDWAGDPCVRRLTPAERGVWIDLLALASVGSPAGYVCDHKGNPLSYEEIGRFTNASPTEVESLIAGILEKGAASRDRTGRLFNRRMTRQAEKSAKKRMAGKLGGEQTKKTWDTLKVRAFQNLPQQTLEHVPRHSEPPPSNPISKITTASVVEGQMAGQGASAKPPHAVSRSELDAILAAKRAH